MQKGSIRVQTENIVPIIKKFLYSEHDIFLRELVSNAVDATQKLKTLSSIGEAKGELGELKIDVKIDVEKKTLTIGFTGATGGKMKDTCDYLINVPSTDTPRIQESHIMIGHIICELVEANLFG